MTLPDDREQIRPWLRLMDVPGVGAGLYLELLRVFGSPEAALAAPPERLAGVPRMDRATAEAIRNSGEGGWVDAQLRAMGDEGVGLLTFTESAYPPLLKEIHSPPPLLFYRGEPTCLLLPALAIVGARATTTYGRQVARMLATDLTERGYAIVSGMARGIDTVAHRAALERGGRTVAVLGCGVDRVYPAENRELQERITRDGMVVSEFPMGSAPEAHRFPQRNRIISGLSLGVVVVEASSSSGALLTARHALEQGREVFAVPGPITSDKSRGTNRLIQEGAKLVAAAADVTEEFQFDLKGSRPPPEKELPVPGELPEEARALLRILTQDPTHIDDLASAARLPPGRALSLLLSLELSGFVRQLPGTRFVRT